MESAPLFGRDRESLHKRVRSVFARRLPSTRTTERIGVAVVTVLALIAFGFVLLYWLQRQGYARPAYHQFLRGAETLDILLGTNLFRHPPVWHSISSAILAGIAVPLVGTFLVHREQALIGETLAHTAFAGVALGAVLGGLVGWSIPTELVALVVSVASAFLIQWFSANTDSHGDVPLAIVLTGSFAVGTLLISYSQGSIPLGVEIEEYLFGSAAIVTETGARMMAGISAIVLGTVALYYKQLLYITFDTPAARAARIDVRGFETLLVVMAAAVVVGAMQILGVILVAGLLVVPAATASQVAGSFRELVVLSVLFGEFSVAVGLFVSMVAGLPSGGVIITLAILLYLFSLVRSDRSPRSLAVH